MTSWSSAISAATPNFTSRKRYVIQSMIPSDPTMIRMIAWLTRSELTTGPMVVRLACSSIGPSSASRAITISPICPVVGRFGVAARGGRDRMATARRPANLTAWPTAKRTVTRTARRTDRGCRSRSEASGLGSATAPVP